MAAAGLGFSAVREEKGEQRRTPTGPGTAPVDALDVAPLSLVDREP